MFGLWILFFVHGVRSGDLAMDSYNRAFYVASGGVGYFVVDSAQRQKPNRDQFWRTCEQIEAVEDAYQKTGDSIYKGMIGELINGLNQIVSGTEDWASWNHFNDDISWGVIALARSYQLTGNKAHLSQAEIQFNKMWARGWDPKNGGLFWNTDKQTKNACINGPASIAAFLLANSTTHTGFRDQAKQAFGWLVNHLYNKTTGEVADHVDNNGVITWQPWTYNQGTFIGAALLYSQIGGDNSYISDGRTAGLWAKQSLTGQHLPGILNDEDDSNDGDGVGFKGIFARWAGRFASATENRVLGDWLNLNARTAWQFRNSAGVTWTQWWHRTSDSFVTSWECSSAVAILQV